MAFYFIADTHFGHENALAFDNRPFRNIEEHDRALAENWNGAVGMDDEVFILGDLSWMNASKTIALVKELNGIKHLIVGNHDKNLLKNREFQSLFAEITDYKEILLPDKTGLVLSHYPIPCFNHHFYGWYHFYGHVHVSFEWNMMERVQGILDGKGIPMLPEIHDHYTVQLKIASHGYAVYDFVLPVMVLLGGLSLEGALMICGAFLICASAGNILALMLLLRFNAFTLLTAVE